MLLQTDRSFRLGGGDGGKRKVQWIGFGLLLYFLPACCWEITVIAYYPASGGMGKKKRYLCDLGVSVVRNILEDAER